MHDTFLSAAILLVNAGKLHGFAVGAPSGVSVGLEVTRERRVAVGRLRWKPEMVRPHLEAEPAASGPRAVTQRWANSAVPRTFSSGETRKTSKHESQFAERGLVVFFTHTTWCYFISHPLSYVNC